MNYTKRTLGEAPVDSGQLLIVDPCYLGDYIGPRRVSYPEVCALPDGVGIEGGETPAFSDRRGTGVTASNWGGDGVYPVVQILNERKVAVLTVIIHAEEGDELLNRLTSAAE